MKNIFLIITVLASFQFSRAQNPIDPKDVSHLKQAGEMFTVKIIPGDKVSSFYILGKEAAKIKIDKLSVEATLFVGTNEKKIILEKKKDHFTTITPLIGDSIRLKLKDQQPEKMEEIRIKLVP